MDATVDFNKTGEPGTGVSQDERLMAALAHVTALLPFVGVLAPIVIWVTQKDKSQHVAFQALQATAYQLTMILAWFLGMACYMSSFFGMFLGALILPSPGAAPQDELFMLPFMFLPFAVLAVIMIGGTAFVLYGLIGALMNVRGRPFQYVFIGARVTRYLQQTAVQAPDSQQAAGV